MNPPREVDLRLKSPSTVMVSGPTGSGKTVLLSRLIRMSQEVSDPPPKEIIYCYGVWQKKFEELEGMVRFHEGMINVQADIPSDGEHRWLIIDDLMDEVGGKDTTNALFTKFSHHMNITVFFVVQNLFMKANRTVSVNSHYFFLFKNPRDATTVGNLAKQAFPGKVAAVQEVFADATLSPHSYLLVNLRQETPEWARLIGNYASDDKAMTVYII